MALRALECKPLFKERGRCSEFEFNICGFQVQIDAALGLSNSLELSVLPLNSLCLSLQPPSCFRLH